MGWLMLVRMVGVPEIPTGSTGNDCDSQDERMAQNSLSNTLKFSAEPTAQVRTKAGLRLRSLQFIVQVGYVYFFQKETTIASSTCPSHSSAH
eukprot:3495305-Rhodomonas_salina.2